MGWQQTYKHILILVLSLVLGYGCMAQMSRSIYRTSVLYDTLVASSSKEFLFNSVTITNQTTEKISLVVNIIAPKGWSSTQKMITLSLNGNENTIIPVRLSPQGTQTSGWQTVRLEYRLNNSVEPDIDTFRIRLKEFSKFRSTLLNPNIVLSGYQKNMLLPVYIKNLGNTPDIYTVVYSNDFVQLREKLSFPLNPTHDTTLMLPLKLSENQYSMLRKEEVKVFVSNKAGETVNLSQNVSKIGYVLKENSTAYLDMPLQVEAGAMYSGVGNTQYFGGIRGSVDVTDYDRVAVDYKSDTYAPGQIVNNHVIKGEYSGKHISALAGNVMEVTDFFMDGYGGNLGYKWDDRNEVKVYSMLKSRIGDAKLFGGESSFGLTPALTGYNTATVNLDNVKKLNSYLVKQAFDYRFGGDGKLIVHGGVGMDESKGRYAGTDSSRLLGSHYGYEFQWTNKRIAILSNLTSYSNSFPGIYKGQRIQNHDVRLFYKSAFIGGFYEYNFRQQNYFLDDSLYSDVFNLKTSNYGGRIGFNYKNKNIILSLGKQEQQQPDQNANPLYIFSYANVNLAAGFGEHFYFNINSFLGTGSLAGKSGTNVPVYSNQLSLQAWFAGLSLRYDVGPFYYHEYIAYLKSPDQYKRIIIGPFIEKGFFQRNLNVRAQFNYSKNMPNTTEISNIMGSIQYVNPVKGFDFNVSGIIPVSQQNATPYISVSLRFKLHAPFLPIRKYYQLKTVLFKDLNGNGEQDAGEEPIPEQMLAINNNFFLTNENGNAIFKNVSKGDYKLDFGYSSKIKGWIPVGGTVQNIKLKGNKTIYIPYKISKVLHGKLFLTVDSNSNLTFSVANIRVTATTGLDSATTYSTITNEDGEFYFNLPDGDYLVTLNEGAFDENFRPVQLSQRADLINNKEKSLFFEIKQKKRAINIRKK